MPSNQHQHHHRHHDESLLGQGDFADQHHRHRMPAKTHASNLQQRHRPYWKRAHRDWRMWLLVVLIIGCLGIYLLTGDLHRPLSGPQQPIATIAH